MTRAWGYYLTAFRLRGLSLSCTSLGWGNRWWLQRGLTYLASLKTMKENPGTAWAETAPSRLGRRGPLGWARVTQSKEGPLRLGEEGIDQKTQEDRQNGRVYR